MTLLTIVQGAANDCGFAPPSTVIGSSDETAIQMLPLLNAEGKHLARSYDFQRMIVETSFTTRAQEQQITLASLSSSWCRLINGSMYNRTSNRPVNGPIEIREWQAYKAQPIGTYQDNFRIRGDAIVFLPTPASGESVYLEYVRKEWVLAEDGTTYKDTFTLDTDGVLIDEELLRLGLVWRFLSRKGMDYSEDYRNYLTRLKQVTGQDGAKPVLSLSGARPMMSNPNLPEGDWTQ